MWCVVVQRWRSRDICDDPHSTAMELYYVAYSTLDGVHYTYVTQKTRKMTSLLTDVGLYYSSGTLHVICTMLSGPRNFFFQNSPLPMNVLSTLSAYSDIQDYRTVYTHYTAKNTVCFLITTVKEKDSRILNFSMKIG